MATIGQLVKAATVLFNTKTGGYIQWEDVDNEQGEERLYSFSEDGVALFVLGENHELIDCVGTKEFIIYEDAHDAWFIRPFFEVDVDVLLKKVPTDEFETVTHNVHSELEGIIRETESIYTVE